MADTPEDIRNELEKQIADLRKEVAQLTKAASERGEAIYEDLRDNAEGLYDNASTRARGAAKQVRDQAHMVSEAIRDNPGTAATVLSSAGLVGFLLGLVVGQMLTGHDRLHRWH